MNRNYRIFGGVSGDRAQYKPFNSQTPPSLEFWDEIEYWLRYYNKTCEVVKYQHRFKYSFCPDNYY